MRDARGCKRGLCVCAIIRIVVLPRRGEKNPTGREKTERQKRREKGEAREELGKETSNKKSARTERGSKRENKTQKTKSKTSTSVMAQKQRTRGRNQRTKKNTNTHSSGGENGTGHRRERGGDKEQTGNVTRQPRSTEKWGGTARQHTHRQQQHSERKLEQKNTQ
jgi:hypothetical protein